MVEIAMRKSKRAKRILLKVSPEGEVVLVLPRWVTFAQGRKFAAQQREWLEKILEEQKARRKNTAAISVSDGAQIPLFGETLFLHIDLDPPRARVHVARNGSHVTVHAKNNSHARKALIAWYLREAKKYFSIKAPSIARTLGKEVSRIRVIDMKTRWGSCNARSKTITFNYRLALAPEEIAFSVICHEVAHLVHPNHSKGFWNLVGTLNPSYSRHRAWLRQFGGGLRLE